MAACDALISMGLTTDCTSAPARGLEPAIILINRADIDFGEVDYSTTHKNTVTALELKTGKKGYLIELQGSAPATGSTSEAEVGTYATTVNKSLVIPVLRNDRDLAEKLGDPMLNGEFVAIREFKDKGAGNNSAFEIIGLQNGAKLSAYSEDPYGDTFGGGLYTLTETGASRTRIYLGETYSAGKALWDSLLEAAS